jgi:hypothetical protein
MAERTTHKPGARNIIAKSAVFTIGGDTGATSFYNVAKDAAKAKNPGIKDSENESSSPVKWVSWGDDNDFPQQLVERVGLLSIGNRAICLNADLHFGTGVEFYKAVYENNKRTFFVQQVAGWAETKSELNLEVIRSETVEALEKFYWAPVRCLTNVGKTKIVEMEVLDPCFTRLGKRNKKGRIEKVYFSYKFPGSPKEDEYIEYPVFDPSEPDKHTEFVVNIFYPTFGKVYYPEPDYWSVFKNGWVDIAISVAEFIKTIYELAATIKYHIKIPWVYFEKRFPGFADFSEKKKDACIEKVMGEMDKWLFGKENAHKTFVSFFGRDDSGNIIDSFEIISINDYLRKDADLPNAFAANSEILFAFGIDPSIIGLGIPGGKELSGSGSDKRISVTIKQGLAFRERTYSLQLIKFVALYNRLPVDGLEPRVMDIEPTTLNENQSGTKEVTNA